MVFGSCQPKVRPILDFLNQHTTVQEVCSVNKESNVDESMIVAKHIIYRQLSFSGFIRDIIRQTYLKTYGVARAWPGVKGNMLYT